VLIQEEEEERTEGSEGKEASAFVTGGGPDKTTSPTRGEPNRTGRWRAKRRHQQVSDRG